MSIQQLFSVILSCISIAGISSSLSMELFLSDNVGPGFFPLIYSVLLAAGSVLLFLQGGSRKIPKLESFTRKPLCDSAFFYLMLIVCFFSAKYLGLPLALCLFTAAVLFQQRKLSPWQILVFEGLFMVFLYLLFVRILKVPFEQGMLFSRG